VNSIKVYVLRRRQCTCKSSVLCLKDTIMSVHVNSVYIYINIVCVCVCVYLRFVSLLKVSFANDRFFHTAFDGQQTASMATFYESYKNLNNSILFSLPFVRFYKREMSVCVDTNMEYVTRVNECAVIILLQLYYL